MNINTKLLSERVKSMRDKSGLSQEELASAVDLSRPFIQKIEQDRLEYKPKTKNLMKIAEVLGTTLEYLLGGEEKINNNQTAKKIRDLENEIKVESDGRAIYRKLLKSLLIDLGVSDDKIGDYFDGNLGRKEIVKTIYKNCHSGKVNTI